MTDFPHFALQEDLDMLQTDIYELKRAYSHLDLIATLCQRMELEQLAQGAQMRRMESQLNNHGVEIKRIKERLTQIEDHLQMIDQRVNALEKRMDALEKRFGSFEKLLLLICAKLEIKVD